MLTAETNIFAEKPTDDIVDSSLMQAACVRDGQAAAPGGERLANQQLTLDQPRVFSIYGEPLLGPQESTRLFERHYFNQDDPASIPRRILRRITISQVTGCWLPDYYLNHAGYAGSTDRDLGMTASGQSGLHRVTRARHEIPEGIPMLTPEHDVEHACRCTSCCNPGHSWRLSSAENNYRKDQARHIEAALISGQLSLLAARSYLEPAVAALLEGNEVILASRFGAYELTQPNEESLMVTLRQCVAREKLRRYGKKPIKRYEKPKIADSQIGLGAC